VCFLIVKLGFSLFLILWYVCRKTLWAVNLAFFVAGCFYVKEWNCFCVVLFCVGVEYFFFIFVCYILNELLTSCLFSLIRI
jgi:hypothetical protein